VDECLNEYYAATPSVEEVEVLIGDTSYHSEDTLPRGQGDSEWGEGERQGANSVRKPTHSDSGVVEARRSFHGSDPGLIDHANKPGMVSSVLYDGLGLRQCLREDKQVPEKNRQNQDLKSSDMAKEGPESFGQQILPT
jgi:hypothetical protein